VRLAIVCLFTFWPVGLKQLHSLTTTITFSLLSGPEVTHLHWVQEIPGLIPGCRNDLLCLVLCFVVIVCFNICLNTLLLRNFVIPIAKCIYLGDLKQLSFRCSKKKKWKQNIKTNGKYWSSYVQWRNLLLLTP